MTDPLTMQKMLADKFASTSSQNEAVAAEPGSQILNLFSGQTTPNISQTGKDLKQISEIEAIGDPRTVADLNHLREGLIENLDRSSGMPGEAKVLHPFVIAGIMITLASVILAGEYLL